MSYVNTIIKSIGICFPGNKIHNSYYIDHFKKQNIDITNLLSTLDRKERFICNDENETSLTMGVKAAKTALEKSNLDAKDIDMLVFVSETPEYSAPCNAIKLHNMLGTENAHVVYDMNCNCVGAIVAIDQISRNMRTNKKIKKALIICPILTSLAAKENDPLIYALFGDSACAIILENVEETEKKGFLDSIYHTDSVHHYTAAFPSCGYSNILRGNITELNEVKWSNTPFKFDFITDVWTKIINELLETNDVKTDEIEHFIFSQFSKRNIINTLKNLGVDSNDISKYTFVADEYGYTGATSPILALNRALETSVIKENSLIVLSSVGVGYSTAAILYKF